ncbi:hypothetical protein MVEN_01606500 [Mycena venus]|uniref:Uncharacterized protein n=1 Tax=Mycena venus TaxID=2733690 RepID=A0A8H6XQW5_9AGAR|nr:hypothetical protein MVEN_01606500 [Mycena venus]
MQFKQILSSLLILAWLAAAAPSTARSKQTNKFSYDKAVRVRTVQEQYGKRADFEDEVQDNYGKRTDFEDEVQDNYGKRTDFEDEVQDNYGKRTDFEDEVQDNYGKRTDFEDEVQDNYGKRTDFEDEVQDHYAKRTNGINYTFGVPEAARAVEALRVSPIESHPY